MAVAVDVVSVVCYGAVVLVAVGVLTGAYLAATVRPDKRANRKSLNFLLYAILKALQGRERALDTLLYMCKTWGGKTGQGTMRFKLPLKPSFTVTHSPEVIKHVLTHTDIYGKGPVWRNTMYPILGDGIFSADHECWAKQRKVAVQMFKVNNFRGSIMTGLRAKVRQLLGILDTRTQDEEYINMQALFLQFAADTVGLVSFGKDLNSLDGENKKFTQAFDYCQHYCNNLFLKMAPAWVLNHFTPAGREFQRQMKVMQEFGNGLIKELVADALDKRRRDLDSRDSYDEEMEPDNILRLFLQREELSPGLMKDKEALRRLRDIVMNFQIAGRDGVAQALSWSMFALCNLPAVQDKIAKEARAVLKDTPIEEMTYEQLVQLKYTYAVATEVLRLFPSVPKEGKWCYKDDVLPDGTRMKANSWILFSPYVMGRLESLWPEPYLFQPERHLTTKPSPFVFTAFQGGPRICLGMNLAYMQLQYVLAALCTTYRFEKDPEQLVEPIQDSVLLPQKEGVRVKFTRRAEEEDLTTAHGQQEAAADGPAPVEGEAGTAAALPVDTFKGQGEEQGEEAESTQNQ